MKEKENENETLPVIAYWLKYYSIIIMVLILGVVCYCFLLLSIKRSYEAEVVDFSPDKTKIIISSKNFNIIDMQEAYIHLSSESVQVNTISILDKQGLYQLNTSGFERVEKGEKARLDLKYQLYKKYLKNEI